MTPWGIFRRVANKASLKRPLEFFVRTECSIARRWASASHKHLMAVQWDLPPQPEFFDNQINQFFQWENNLSPWWLERGVFSSLAIKNQARVLDLCCGDGFHAKYFYACKASAILACDFDESALAVARKKNAAPNIFYVQSDIRTAMPDGLFDAITWNGAIEHFTLNETTLIIASIKQRLAVDGILSGYTIAQTKQEKSLSHHEYEFRDKDDLRSVLAPHFAHVKVFETIYRDRHNLYWWASDYALPDI